MERTEQVERMTEHGCAVLCLDCPEGMLFGIDYSAWSVGPRFMGVKLVPPGLHFVYASGSSEDVGISRTGFFLHMKPREVAVFRWDPATEELVRPENADEEARFADGVRGFDFDANLGPYPLDLSAQWSELTRHASAPLVAKIEPVAKAVRSKRAEYDAASAATEAALAAAAAAQQAEADGEEGDDAMDDAPAGEESRPGPAEASQPPRLESNSSVGSLFFSSVPRVRRKKGAAAAETTSMHFDRSKLLEQMIARDYGGDEMGVLGELQVAYIAFILGQNFDGFEQWRALLLLLCSCEAAASTRPELYAELCRVFFAQLNQAPGDLFGDDLTKENFLGSCALSLLEICDADGIHPKVRKRCGKLRELVQAKFGISVEDLALIGEDAPQIVDADGRDLVDLSGPALIALD